MNEHFYRKQKRWNSNVEFYRFRQKLRSLMFNRWENKYATDENKQIYLLFD